MATKRFASSILAEIKKRVPPNQLKYFDSFHNKSLEYQRKVNQYPGRLPSIDWDYYRNNVREDYVKMVEQFQIKYEELNQVFNTRNEILDHSSYYKELEELKLQVQEELKEFIEESQERVEIYENEIKRLKSLNYDIMTLEQFIEAREDIAKFIPGQGKPLFWPHTVEEQIGEGVNFEEGKKDDKK